MCLKEKRCVGMWGVTEVERSPLPGVCDGWGSAWRVCRAGGLKESLGTAEVEAGAAHSGGLLFTQEGSPGTDTSAGNGTELV